MKKSRVISCRRVINIIRNVARSLRRDRINVYAAESAFFIVLSAVPFVIMLVAVARYVIADGAYESIEWLVDHIPGVLGEYVKTEFLAFAEHPTSMPLSLAALGTLWSASRGMKAVRRGIRSVFGEDQGTFLSENLRGIAFTMMFLLLIVLLLIFLVFGKSISGVIREENPALSALVDLIIKLSPFFFSLMFLIIFAIMYKTLTPESAKMTKYIYHLPGALFSALGWIIASYIFAYFVVSFSNMPYIYGSLTSIMILMLWIYIIMYILLLGAMINKYLYNWIYSKSE